MPWRSKHVACRGVGLERLEDRHLLVESGHLTSEGRLVRIDGRGEHVCVARPACSILAQLSSNQAEGTTMSKICVSCGKAPAMGRIAATQTAPPSAGSTPTCSASASSSRAARRTPTSAPAASSRAASPKQSDPAAVPAPRARRARSGGLFSFQGNVRSRFAISSAVDAAAHPLLPALVPARSTACSMVSVVRTPNTTGTPVSRLALAMPLAVSPAT